jgi:hypothetical protein
MRAVRGGEREQVCSRPARPQPTTALSPATATAAPRPTLSAHQPAKTDQSNQQPKERTVERARERHAVAVRRVLELKPAGRPLHHLLGRPVTLLLHLELVLQDADEAVGDAALAAARGGRGGRAGLGARGRQRPPVRRRGRGGRRRAGAGWCRGHHTAAASQGLHACFDRARGGVTQLS